MEITAKILGKDERSVCDCPKIRMLILAIKINSVLENMIIFITPRLWEKKEPKIGDTVKFKGAERTTQEYCISRGVKMRELEIVANDFYVVERGRDHVV